MVIVNIYIAVILENYADAHEQEEIGVTEDDFKHFYTIWEKYDHHATQFVKLEQLNDLVAELNPPLGIPKPNDMAITSFNLPIIKGELITQLKKLGQSKRQDKNDPQKYILKFCTESSKEFIQKLTSKYPLLIGSCVLLMS